MKLLGVTQGGSLNVFWRIAEHLGAAQDCALYVSNVKTYGRLAAATPALAARPTLKEWDIFAEARSATPDMERLAALQATIDTPLWYAALADRRVFFGSQCKVRQDYPSRYSETEMLAILDVAALRIDAFLEKERPDAVLSFGSATVGDVLFELLCARRGIPFGQLKATKIRNHVALMDSGIRPPTVLAAAYTGMASVPENLAGDIDDYLHSVRQKGVKYEGAILFHRDILLSKLRAAPRRLLSAARSDLTRLSSAEQRNDRHIPAFLPAAWHTNVVQPLRTFSLGRRLPLLKAEDLDSQGRFAFYPMHFEPEVSLQVFGRPFQNQIEVVRTLALSLPVGTRLLVKEHPRSLGYRRESYYRKLLDIPNVRLVDPFVPTIDIVRRARLVSVVSGSVGLEAAIVGKPVLVLGATHYTLLPESMVQQAGDLNLLSAQIKALIGNYAQDENALRRYLAALLSISVPANLYTGLLGKRGRHSIAGKDTSVDDDYAQLAALVERRLPISAAAQSRARG